MEDAGFDKYAEQLSSMKRAVVKGYRAPHKPVLLLAICELVADGEIKDNRIYLTDGLVRKFREVWKRFVDNEENVHYDCVAEELFKDQRKAYPFKCNIANPFYHLSGEPFWKLKKSELWRERTSWSMSALKTDFEYAILDKELFGLMSDGLTREKIYSLLIGLL
jgi:putative restriction endonuclease